MHKVEISLGFQVRLDKAIDQLWFAMDKAIAFDIVFLVSMKTIANLGLDYNIGWILWNFQLLKKSANSIYICFFYSRWDSIILFLLIKNHSWFV